MGVHTTILPSAQLQLCRFQFNEFAPFGPTPLDAARNLLAQSAGLAMLLSEAFDQAQKTTEHDDVEMCQPALKARSFAAIASLNAMAAFLLQEVADAPA